MSIRGQRVVIVGGSSGIGLATARACVEAGAEVMVAARDAARLQAALQTLGAGVVAHRCDITLVADVERLCAGVGAFDHLVLPGSSGAVVGTLDRLDLEQARGFLDSKLLGPLRVAQRAASAIRAGGSITFFSGAASRKLAPGGALISAVNAAVEAAASTLALELPLRVNTLAPGLTDTPVWEGLAGPEGGGALTEAAARLPLRRIASADEIAHAAVFLMENPYTTGSVLLVDGGYAHS